MDIELVIKIPEETYEYWKEHSYEYVFAQAIKDGVILPKGHGRLIDADKLKEQAIEVKLENVSRNIRVITRRQIEDTPTIIEADKAESEPQEISDRNLKMWEEIYAEEKRRESEDA